MDKNGIYYIPLKRIMNGQEFAEIYDSTEEFDALYNDIARGLLPTTSQINPDEFVAHFTKILEKEKEGDIIHISLSSGLSGSHNSAVIAAEIINKTIKDRKIYAFDSLGATGTQMMLIDKFMELRGQTSTEDAIKQVEEIRANQQIFFLVDDLFHLKRGGRLSVTKAIFGTLLGVKPILILNNEGKIVIENTIRSNTKAVKYLLDMLKTHHYKDGTTVYIMRSTENNNYSLLKKLIIEKYPDIPKKEAIVGPIIGAHLGCGVAAVIFQGDKRTTKK